VIKSFLLSIRCKITKHNYIGSGSCPFTGKTYNVCEKCWNTVEA
jgi:hypothetical protein